MKLRAVLLAVLLALGVTGAARAESTGEINLVAGTKLLDKGDWAPTEEHREVGILATVGDTDWPVALDLRLFRSTSDTELLPGLGLTAKLETRELDVGVRLPIRSSDMRPYVAAGLARIDGDLTISGATGSDDAVGAWVALGIGWLLGSHMNLGFDLMYSTAKVDFGTGVDANLGGTHLNLVVGYHF